MRPTHNAGDAVSAFRHIRLLALQGTQLDLSPEPLEFVRQVACNLARRLQELAKQILRDLDVMMVMAPKELAPCDCDETPLELFRTAESLVSYG